MTSLSDTSDYREVVEAAIVSDYVYQKFRTDPRYLKGLGVTTPEQAEKYRKLTGSNETDPNVCRYQYEAQTIHENFGSLKDKHIVEIGGGYGGLAEILLKDQPASYTILDLTPVCMLIEKRLGNQVKCLSAESDYSLKEIDLVISNYGMSECKSEVRADYTEKILKASPAGYLTVNLMSEKDKTKLINQVNKGNFKFIPEPVRNSSIIIWGNHVSQ